MSYDRDEVVAVPACGSGSAQCGVWVNWQKMALGELSKMADLILKASV